MAVDQLPRLEKRELVCLLLFTCDYVVSVWRGFLFLWVLGMGYVILLWHSLGLPYNYYQSPLVCISKGICDPLSRDRGLNQDKAFCFGLILMPKFSTRHIGCFIAYWFQFLDCIIMDIH